MSTAAELPTRKRTESQPIRVNILIGTFTNRHDTLRSPWASDDEWWGSQYSLSLYGVFGDVYMPRPGSQL